VKILKNRIQVLILLLTCGQCIGQSRFFYEDGLFEFNGLKIKFANGYGRNTRAKTDLIINNFSDHFAIIDPADIFVVTSKGKEVPTTRKKIIVIPPKDIIRLHLGFMGTSLGATSMNIGIKKILFTDTTFEQLGTDRIPADVGAKYQKNALQVSIVEIKPREKDYFIKLELVYSGDKFLTIKSSKAFFTTESNGGYHNMRKNKLFYDNNLPSQGVSMVFPCTMGKDVQIQGAINLSEVFKEYSTNTIEGFKIKLACISNKNPKGEKIILENSVEEIE
jgi:hypothetical protein